MSSHASKRSMLPIPLYMQSNSKDYTHYSNSHHVSSFLQKQTHCTQLPGALLVISALTSPRALAILLLNASTESD